MPIPNIPTNFYAAPGQVATSGNVYLRWDAQVGATSASTGVAAPSTGAYDVLRSLDNLNFSVLSSINSNQYYDNTASTGVIYFYSVRANGNSGQGGQAQSLQISVAPSGKTTLGAVRLAAQQRSDMINNNFVTLQEWNDYINHSYAELYDILIQVYADDYYIAAPYSFSTDSRSPGLYPLPNDHYKLLGVDLALGTTAGNTTGWLTLKKFAFISRNRYIFGNVPVSFLGLLGLRYRLEGNYIEFIPQPSSNQTIRLRYIPKPTLLLADSDVLDGISGWDEYVIVDAAIKALQKEESDVSILMAQKAGLIKRIESASQNRDAGQPECVSDLRRMDGGSGGDPYGDGPMGGWAIALPTLFYMWPSFIIHNVANRCLGNSEFFPYFFLRDRFGFVKISNFENNFLSDFCGFIFNSFQATAMASAFAVSIFIIIKSSSKKKMIWPNARWIVAFVTNKISSFNWAKMYFPTFSVRSNFFLSGWWIWIRNRYLSITKIVFFTNPFPTFGSLFNLIPKPIHFSQINKPLGYVKEKS